MTNERPHREKEPYRADSWRVFRIISEFVDGFEKLTEIGPSVSIFGSSRLDDSNPYYTMAVEVAKKIAEKGFAVITGGGPGIMEAANKGAQFAGGLSCGVSIEVPRERESNQFIDARYQMKFRYFFIRKVMFVRYAQACVFLPGGFGTLDELFETLTLIQTEKIRPFPVYLMGASYWEGLKEWLIRVPQEHGCISDEEIAQIRITDDPDEVAETIEKHYKKDQQLKNF